MPAAKKPTKPEATEPDAASLGLVPVTTIPKSTRSNKKHAALIAVLIKPENVGESFQLPPKTTGTAIKKALAKEGFACETASRALNGSRAHFVTVTGPIEPETKQEGE